jgi:putative ATPase
VKAYGSLAVPMVMRNAPTALMKGLGYGEGYQYAHSHQAHVVHQQHRPEELEGRRYYEPSDEGFERTIRERLDRIRGK